MKELKRKCSTCLKCCKSHENFVSLEYLIQSHFHNDSLSGCSKSSMRYEKGSLGGRNANSYYYKSMERLFGTKKVKVCLGYYNRKQCEVATCNVPNALLWVFHNKPLPWQLNLQPHKRNTSNSFFRMTQISHRIKGLVLKILL